MTLPPRLISLLRERPRTVVHTGAGMSAESGIATFRSSGGMWDRLDLMDLATPDGFLRHTEASQRWYAQRMQQAQTVTPHAGYDALVHLEHEMPVTIVTQNVDGLHHRAGSSTVHELHGTLRTAHCFACGHPSHLADATDFPVHCTTCGGFIRPDVVWFGEMLPEAALSAAFAATETCALFLHVGTSSNVYPAASLPGLARDAGAMVVEINPEPGLPHGVAHYTLPHPAGQALPALVNALRT